MADTVDHKPFVQDGGLEAERDILEGLIGGVGHDVLCARGVRGKDEGGGESRAFHGGVLLLSFASERLVIPPLIIGHDRALPVDSNQQMAVLASLLPQRFPRPRLHSPCRHCIKTVIFLSLPLFTSGSAKGDTWAGDLWRKRENASA